VEASKLRDMAREQDEEARTRANAKRRSRELRTATPIDLFIRKHGLIPARQKKDSRHECVD
jgi:hypothetical protein